MEISTAGDFRSRLESPRNTKRKWHSYFSQDNSPWPLSDDVTHLEHSAAVPSFGTHLVAVIVHGFCTWTLIALFVGGALRFFDYESPWILYISQSAYWVFLVHLPVACFAGWWMVQYDLPAELKFLLVIAFTMIVCFVTYHYWVQKTWVSAFLNGRRFDLDWPWAKGGRDRKGT